MRHLDRTTDEIAESCESHFHTSPDSGVVLLMTKVFCDMEMTMEEVESLGRALADSASDRKMFCDLQSMLMRALDAQGMEALKGMDSKGMMEAMEGMDMQQIMRSMDEAGMGDPLAPTPATN